jgi:2-keto-3-deoxy-L-rhamnonate aldolase RhmA
VAAYPNRAKHRLAAGQLAVGLVLRQSRTVDIGPIARMCGFDFLSLDLEHSSLDVDTAAQIAMTATMAGIAPLVRAPQTALHDAARLLDSGAQGVIVPHVSSAREAREIVDLFRYPPAGHRSIAALMPQLAFERHPAAEAARLVDDETLLVAMLETQEAIDAADEIAAVGGIDVLLVGTHDLCAGMGIPGRVDDPRIEAAYRHVIAACRRYGISAGMAGVHDPKVSATLVEAGVRYIVAGVDTAFLVAGASQRASFLHGLLK